MALLRFPYCCLPSLYLIYSAFCASDFTLPVYYAEHLCYLSLVSAYHSAIINVYTANLSLSV